jgi:hypothetical protein
MMSETVALTQCCTDDAPAASLSSVDVGVSKPGRGADSAALSALQWALRTEHVVSAIGRDAPEIGPPGEPRPRAL